MEEKHVFEVNSMYQYYLIRFKVKMPHSHDEITND